MGQPCLFCRIVHGEIPCAKIYEDKTVLAFLDIGPVSDGHCLLIPKQHYSRLDDCPEAVLSVLTRHIASLARAVLSIVKAEGYNVLLNNGRVAGQLIEHVHFHIIPRRQADGIFGSWPAAAYPPGRIDELARLIRNQL